MEHKNDSGIGWKVYNWAQAHSQALARNLHSCLEVASVWGMDLLMARCIDPVGTSYMYNRGTKSEMELVRAQVLEQELVLAL